MPRRTRPTPITLAHVEQAVAHASVRYDKTGDQHYDVASALIKSMRGSDVDAALHYLARMLEAGEDPLHRPAHRHRGQRGRRTDPTALQTSVAAMHAVAQIGMPEARIILAQAVVHNALAPKNASYLGINAAIADIRAGRGGAVPPHLRGSGMPVRPGSGTARGTCTPTTRHGVARQQYLPDDLEEDRLLPADGPGLRGAPGAALAVAARADPRQLTTSDAPSSPLSSRRAGAHPASG